MSIVTQGLGGNETSLILQGFGYSAVVVAPVIPVGPVIEAEVIVAEEGELEWFYDYAFKFTPVERIIAEIVYPIECTKGIRANVSYDFGETTRVKSKVVLSRFSETTPVTSYLVIEFTETRQVISGLGKKFDETCQINALVSMYFSQQGKVFAETISTEEDITDELELMDKIDKIEKGMD